MQHPLLTFAITGEHYRLTAEATSTQENGMFDFVLRAVHLESGRMSVVNQVNFLLSWFDAGEREQEDWLWEAKWSKIVRWLRGLLDLAKPRDAFDALLCKTTPFEDLEAALDADRREGEWANWIEDDEAERCPMCASTDIVPNDDTRQC